MSPVTSQTGLNSESRSEMEFRSDPMPSILIDYNIGSTPVGTVSSPHYIFIISLNLYK